MVVLCWLYFCSLGVLALFGFYRTSLLYRLARKPYQHPPMAEPRDWPKVCVQLPVYNEESVVARLIQSVSAIRYPSDKFEIQILDDSTDQTSSIVDGEIAVLRGQGVNISVIRRRVREDFKAGALRAGIKKSDADFFAVFDADFIPDEQFLLRTIPYFQDSKIAYVQTRWSFVNRATSFLTRAQAVLLDGHFVVEHAARALTGFFNFNGTAGVWRRSAIESAGGWSGDTLTEDLDLSYRALLAGWKVKYLRDYCSPSELPETIEAFKGQQHRWMKGTAQVAKKLLSRILMSKVSVQCKIDCCFHLLSGICYPFMLAVAALIVPVTIFRSQNDVGLGLWFEPLILVMTLFSLTAFYVFSQVQQGRRVRISDLFLAIILGGGIALHCTKAVIAGWFQSEGEFVRTPKTGNLQPGSSPRWRELLTQTLRGNILHLRNHLSECLFAMYLLMGVWYLFTQSLMLTIPFVLLLFAGYGIVIMSALLPRYE